MLNKLVSSAIAIGLAAPFCMAEITVINDFEESADAAFTYDHNGWDGSGSLGNETTEEGFIITTKPDDFMNVQKKIADALGEPENAELTWVPNMPMDLDDEAYAKIEGIDADIREVEIDLSTQMEAEATKKGAHEALVQITENWDEWTSFQKKRLVQAWIKELHLFTKKQKSGAWIKGIVFQFPVVVFGQISDAFDFPADADDPGENYRQQETTDETVVLMTRNK